MQIELKDMVYAVDIVVRIITELGSSPPILFQRNGSLYVVACSEQGRKAFGQVTHGFKTYDNTPKGLDPSEVTDVILDQDQERYVRRELVFLPGQEAYLTPLWDPKKVECDGDGRTRFSLEEITSTAAELTKLPDDGKIRLVQCVDTGLSKAYVMDRARYLELLRQKETEFYQRMCLMAKSHAEDLHQLEWAYDNLEYPDCIIVTPGMIFSFPRAGILNSDIKYNPSTNERPSFVDFPPKYEHPRNPKAALDMLRFEIGGLPEPTGPFRFQIVTKGNEFKVTDKSGFVDEACRFVREYSRDLTAIYKVIGQIEELCLRLNTMHAQILAQWEKESKRESEERRKRLETAKTT